MFVDSIGVPQKVPNEFKAKNQLAAKFKSSLFWWVTINKNVNHQLKFINYTRNAIKGIAKQLDATS